MNEPRYPYLHVAVASDESAVELLSSLLFELGAQGIEERDHSTLLKSSGGPDTTMLVASFADEATSLAAQQELAGRYEAQLEYVVGDAWRDGWRKYFKPLRVGARLVIRPSWEPYQPQPDDLVITLDPGQAFGTGTHESTQLVLAALAQHVTPGQRVLDLGTGSGILAIAAVLLGAAHVTALDLDPLAISATDENAAVNGVAAAVSARVAGVESVSERFPLVLANIEARVLVPLAAAVSQRVQAGGTLILSGLLHADVERVAQAYLGFSTLAQPCSGDWHALVLHKDS
jgi:ribosomal protein L11 methyltransferase